MRLIRKLCEKCRVPFKPHPSLLQKLGLPANRIAELYKPFVFRPGMVDEDGNEIEPCNHCCGLGYRGRTGIVEFLTINNDLRGSHDFEAETGNAFCHRGEARPRLAKTGGSGAGCQRNDVTGRTTTSLESLARITHLLDTHWFPTGFFAGSKPVCYHTKQ